MTSQLGKQTIAIHTLPNVSRIKDNQAIAFGQLIEYDMGNTFLEKSYAKCGGETICRPFSKKPKLGISLDQDQVYSNTGVPTQVDTNQHESTRINTSPTRVNTNQHESDTSQYESTQVRHEST